MRAAESSASLAQAKRTAAAVRPRSLAQSAGGTGSEPCAWGSRLRVGFGAGFLAQARGARFGPAQRCFFDRGGGALSARGCPKRQEAASGRRKGYHPTLASPHRKPPPEPTGPRCLSENLTLP